MKLRHRSALPVLSWLVVACSSPAALTPGGDAGDAAVDRPASSDARGGFGASACGRCVRSACAGAMTTCSDDPSCVDYLDCVLACGEAKGGGVDPRCMAHCPRGTATISIQDEQSLAACIGASQVTCEACVADAGSLSAMTHEKCPTVMAMTACGTCALSHCCTARNTCENDHDCNAILHCAAACPADDLLTDAGPDAGFFPSCIEACVEQYPGGLVEFVTFQVCLQADCSAAPACDPIAAVCDRCTFGRCLQQLYDLDTTPGGLGLFSCVSACNDLACAGQCFMQYPAGAAPYNAVFSCQRALCSDSCPAANL